MIILYRNSNRQAIKLVSQIANSGEGRVYKTDFRGYLAKIYHHQDGDRVEKLKVMLANPPEDPMKGHNHVSIAFPFDLLQDKNGNVLGFLMPHVQNSFDLVIVTNPKKRKEKAPNFNWLYLYVTAEHFIIIIQKLHSQHYVLGDIKLQNILVNDRALPTVIDTDSFQVIDSNKRKRYLCPVGSEWFTPPELLGKDLSTTPQTEIHDRFRLGVLIHYLLFGIHPFTGRWLGNGDSPEPNEIVKRGLWHGGQNSSWGPSKHTIPLDVIHPALKQCFLRCFNDGHLTPHLRPTPQEWLKALQAARADLKPCTKVNNHYYSQTYGKCYWCERAVKLSDPFPDTSGKKTRTPQTKTTKTQTKTTTNFYTPPQPPKTGLNTQPTYPSNQAQTNVQTVLQTHYNNAYPIIQYLRKNWKQVTYVALPLIFLVWIFSLFKPPSTSTATETTSPQPSTPVPTLSPEPSTEPSVASISKEDAVSLVKRWLNARSQMFAPPYNQEVGKDLATGKAYSDKVHGPSTDGTETSTLEWLKKYGYYYTYNDLDIGEIKQFQKSGNDTILDLVVTEDKTQYDNRRNVVSKNSGKSKSLMRYRLRYDSDTWKIADIEVLQSLGVTKKESSHNKIGKDPRDTVRDYYSKINKRDYSGAWDSLPTALQNNKSVHPNGYNSFLDWWENQVTEIEIQQINLISQTDRDAVVDADIKYLIKNKRVLFHAIRYYLAKDDRTHDWIIQKIRLRK
jgi:serine/threonine protein kinase